MNQDMAAMPMNGNTDQTLVAMMTPHHQGAVGTAQAEFRYGKNLALRRLANGVISTQKKEIARMQRWQEAHPAR